MAAPSRVASLPDFPWDSLVPAQWSEYYKANVEFFDDVGSPGGAAKMGEIPNDHPIIATLPLQVVTD